MHAAPSASSANSTSPPVRPSPESAAVPTHTVDVHRKQLPEGKPVKRRHKTKETVGNRSETGVRPKCGRELGSDPRCFLITCGGTQRCAYQLQRGCRPSSEPPRKNRGTCQWTEHRLQRGRRLPSATTYSRPHTWTWSSTYCGAVLELDRVMGNVTVDRNRGLSADRGELIIVRGRRRCKTEVLITPFSWSVPSYTGCEGKRHREPRRKRRVGCPTRTV